MNKKLLTPSMEDYLEMIYRCSQNEEFVRLNRIAQKLNVRDSSASKMMKKLGELNLIKYERYGVIMLTEQGKRIGSYLLIRHNIIDKFFEYIGKTDDTLSEIELIEHVISSETVENMYFFNKFLEENKDILEEYNRFKKDKKLKY
ncbi:iron dependent repressor, metal binding and dimerization domain protein [Clostridium sp. SM-530-WT-3G]|uniref:metal-dependent transcriptional regulator n=1 Tax=Clostridium sp. SM-530-WT-3G TaxID=2725303 RepID=UPI00145DF1A2|nr:iron dependent repressor, metal binding and dimerization domain protein [Clostridium sp. SM-530-WT-3G]NME83342.1 DtxR family transcriptional regulator [Clostridium sp. SM-530-WT-3G]